MGRDRLERDLGSRDHRGLGVLYAVATPTPTTMVAVGDGGGSGPVVVYYDGSTWSTTYLGDVTGPLYGAVGDAAGGTWAVGEDDLDASANTVIEHGTGAAFTRVTSPDPLLYNRLQAITARSGVTWTAGFQFDAVPRTLIAYRC